MTDNVATGKIIVVQALQMLHVGWRVKRIGLRLKWQTVFYNKLIEKDTDCGSEIHS